MADDLDTSGDVFLPSDVVDLVSEFARFLVWLGVAADHQVVADFPERGEIWSSFVSAKGADLFFDDDEEVVESGLFPLLTTDEERCRLLNAELGTQMLLAGPPVDAAGSGLLRELEAAFEVAAAATGVDYDIDWWTASGDGQDDRDLFAECRSRSQTSGEPEYLMKVWAEAFAWVWCESAEMCVGWYSWPFPWELSPEAAAHRDGVLEELRAAFATEGLTARWDATDRGTLFLTGFHARP